MWLWKLTVTKTGFLRVMLWVGIFSARSMIYTISAPRIPSARWGGFFLFLVGCVRDDSMSIRVVFFFFFFTSRTFQGTEPDNI